MYIVFEGTVGTGKTTQSKKLAEYLSKKYPNKKIIWTREPGGSEIADAIRKVVQGTVFEEEMDSTCESFLYAWSRTQTLRTIIKPHLKDKNTIIVADRSFITSLAFQGYVRELGIEKVWKLNKEAVEKCLPDKVVYMNIDPAVGHKRSFDKNGDKFEKEKLEFFVKAEKGFKKVSKLPMFKNKWINVNANGDIEEVFDRILKKLKL